MSTTSQSFLQPISKRLRRQRWIAFMLMLALVFPFTKPTAAAGTTYYVDADANGSGSGNSWANAFVFLQDALATATSGDTIWLAEGVYYPDTGGEQADNDRNARFTIPSGVKLYGGFDPSAGVVQFAARNWKLYPSVLSGDIDGNDTKDTYGIVANTSGISGSNSLHVVYLDGGAIAVTSDTIIDGVVITAGAAVERLSDNAGGGLYCDSGVTGTKVCSPTLTNITFSGNKADQTGGAISNDAAYGGTSSPTLTNIVFSGNSAGAGGAIDNNAQGGGTSSPMLTNVTFSGNTSTYYGGAMINRGYGGTSSPTLTNVTFSGNSAGGGGGAIDNDARSGGTSSPTLTNIAFSGNAASFGGALFNGGVGGTSSPTLTNVTFSGNTATFSGGAISSVSRDGGTSRPTLVNTLVWNNTSRQGASVANTNASMSIRFSIVENGTASIFNEEGGSTTYDVTNTQNDPRFDLLVDPATAPTTVGILRLQINSPAIDAGDTSAVPPGVKTDRDGKPRIINGKVDIGAYEFGTVRPAPTYYVDAKATGTNSGTSWANAFVNLQDALTKTMSGDTIWLAEGVYYPDMGGGQTNNDQNARFTIPSGVKLYGGFDPSSSIDQFVLRDGTLYPSVLSGDIDGNDTKDARGVVTNANGIKGTNSTHVVYLDGQTVPVTSATVLDSIVITAGAASAAPPDDSGGGLYCAGQSAGKACSPTLANVIFSGNKASGNGGAMFNYGGSQGASSPALTSVAFSGNSASYGGAMYNYGYSQGASSPTLTNVTFSGNTATANGGAMYNLGLGGTSSPTLTNVTFSGNKAAMNGGAIDNDGRSGGVSNPILTNVTFSGNAAGTGGAIYNFGNNGTSSPTLVNTILWNNAAGQGASVYNANASVAIRSSIVENGQASIVDNGSSSTTYEANTASNPLFVQPINPASAPTTGGDLRLKGGSPAIDAGDTSAVLSGSTTDRDGKTRIINGTIDIGAYEYGIGMVADLGFRPRPDGYSFANNGDVDAADYTTDDMRRSFGDNVVCVSLVNGACVARPVLEQWVVWARNTLRGGHCYGMAATSLRFFKGIDSPASFQNASDSTYELQKANAWRNITSYAIRQHTNPAASAKGVPKTPSEVLAGLRATMRAGAPDPAVLSVTQQGQGGHAITPYAIEDRGNNIFWIDVYDNNHPNDDKRHVEINTAQNTWSYDIGWTTWSGDANTRSLSFHLISYDDATSICHFCGSSGTQSLADTQTSANTQIFSLGQDQLLVVDAQGRRIGNSGSQTVNEIPGSYITPIEGGLGVPQSIYNLPLNGAHSLVLNGTALTRTVTAGVGQFAPGYAVTADGITLKAAIQHKLVIPADGREVAFQAGDATSVNLSLAHDTLGSTNDGYTFKLVGVDVGGNQSVKAIVDAQKGAVAFSNAQASGGSYDLEVERVTSAGKQSFVHSNITVGAGDTQYINYAGWDGSGALTLQIDRGSDGSIDETIVLSNQLSASNSVYLPVVRN